MKTYIGTRTPAGCRVTVNWLNGQPTTYLLPLYLHVRRHSPDGFEWGYSGSGPAQLALALLCNALHVQSEAERLYQDFKREIIAALAKDEWQLTHDEIVRWVAAHPPALNV